MPTLSEIHIYPIKSLGGIALREARLTPLGLENDRRFMLVDERGVFVTQREIPAMTGLAAGFSDAENFKIWSKENPGVFLDLPFCPKTARLEKIRVQVWSSKCAARVMPSGVNDWFSARLGAALRLVYMPDTTRRPTAPLFARGHHVSFADGYPILLLGQASLDELNRRLAATSAPLPMNRFRPNLVCTGSAPHEEDGFGEFSIGAVRFQGVKPCGRCIITTTDQQTGLRGAEPLRTLATYRLRGKSIVFGENLVWLPGGSGGSETIRLGDPIVVGGGI